ELQRLREEMLLADLGIITNRFERLESTIKKPRPDRETLLHEMTVVTRVRDALEAGQHVAELELSRDDLKLFRSFGLLTEKPEVLVVNAALDTPLTPDLLAAAPHAIVIDAKLELELAQLPEDERAAFMEELGVKHLGRERVIRSAYDAVGIITFFTAGEPEVR